MGRRRGVCRPPLPSQLAGLLFLASSASAISLATFQVITSPSVPLGCILAYNQPIQGCGMSDFTSGSQGNTCSKSCQQGIQNTQELLQPICGDVVPSTTSVLGEALLGNLIQLLCMGNGGGAGSAPAPTQTASAPTASQPTTSGTDSGQDPTPEPSPPPPPPPTEGMPSSAETNPQSLQTDTTGAQQTRTPSPAAQAGSTNGGGSPFDAAVSSSAELTIRWTQALLLAVLVGFVLIR